MIEFKSDSVGKLVWECAGVLEKSGNDNAAFEAKQLVMHCFGVGMGDILTTPWITAASDKVRMLADLTERRISGEPLQYLIKEWDFYGLKFRVGEGVLIPRQDTETLAELAVKLVKFVGRKNYMAADLCAGTGCIGITLAKKCEIPVKLVEYSDKAMEYLRDNIALNGVDELCDPVYADVLKEETAEQMPPLDLIVMNPPYLTAQDMRELQKEVTYEPEMALYGGEDGLDYYRRMIPLWSARLKPGGYIATEIGMGQESHVARIFEQCGLDPQGRYDMNGIMRVIYSIKQ